MPDGESGLDPDAIARLLNVARYHRQHERYYAHRDLADATMLREWATVLRTWAGSAGAAVDVSAGESDRVPPLFVPVPSASALVLDDGGSPYLSSLVRSLERTSRRYQRAGAWLASKMEAAWPREEVLLQDGISHVAPPRFEALASTTVNAWRMSTVGALAEAAIRPLRDVLTASADDASRSLRVGSVLLDEASAVLAQKGVALGRVDRCWDQVIERLEASR